MSARMRPSSGGARLTIAAPVHDRPVLTRGVQQLKENMRSVAIEIDVQRQNAINNFRTALSRIDIVSKGIEASQKTLEAEQERFRLGEGTSSNVTDAQKELTSLQQRRTSAAADLLRAKTNYLFAVGYNGEE